MISYFRIQFAAILLFTSILPKTLLAEDSSPQRNETEKLTALLDDETLCVVHVDFTKIDPAIALDSVHKLLDRVIETAKLSQSDRKSLDAFGDTLELDIPKDWDSLKAMASGGKAFLTSGLGVREAYLVVHSGGSSFPALVWVAIPRHGKQSFKSLTELLKNNPELAVRETDDFCFIAPAFPWKLDPSQLGLQLAAHHLAARPELIEAWQAVKDYPVQVLIAPPKYMKKVFREVRPTLPDEFANVDIASIIGAIHWHAIGIDPSRLDFVALTEAESENDAHLLYSNGREIIAQAGSELIALLKNHKDSAGAKDLAEACRGIVNESFFAQLANYLIPQPDGKRMTVRGSAEMLQNVGDNGQKMSVTIVRKIVDSLQERKRHVSTQNQLHQLAVVIHNYQDSKSNFPPAYSVDNSGKPLQSWRVLILPYLEEDKLYHQIRLDEPWDSPFNKQFHNQMPRAYFNSTYPETRKTGETNFCMVVGSNVFGQSNGKGLKIRDIQKGVLSGTIMLIERQTPICWMAPDDIAQDKAYLGINKDPAGIGGRTPGGVHATYADGSARFLEQDTPVKTLKSLLSFKEP